MYPKKKEPCKMPDILLWLQKWKHLAMMNRPVDPPPDTATQGGGGGG